MTRILASLGLALMLAAPGAALAQDTQEAQSSSDATTSEQAQQADGAAAEQEAPEVQEMALGEPGAPVTVVEYASFTCPHCQAFHLGPFEQLKADYIDTGDVRFVLREVYYDRFGLWAGMLARCSGDEERYFEMVNLIFENQGEWTQGGDPAAIAENLRRLGRSAGMEAEQIDACLSDAAKAQAMVTAYQENAEADNVTSTPSFVIDGELHSNMPYDEFSALLDEKLAE